MTVVILQPQISHNKIQTVSEILQHYHSEWHQLHK